MIRREPWSGGMRWAECSICRRGWIENERSTVILGEVVHGGKRDHVCPELIPPESAMWAYHSVMAVAGAGIPQHPMTVAAVRATMLWLGGVQIPGR